MNYFSRTPPFLVLQLSSFQGFLPLKHLLVATLSEMCALHSRKNVPKRGMNVPDFSQAHKIFYSHSTVFALEK